MLYHCCEAVRLHVQGLKSEKSIARREHTVLHRLILGKREQEAKKQKNVGDIFSLVFTSHTYAIVLTKYKAVSTEARHFFKGRVANSSLSNVLR